MVSLWFPLGRPPAGVMVTYVGGILAEAESVLRISSRTTQYGNDAFLQDRWRTESFCKRIEKTTANLGRTMLIPTSSTGAFYFPHNLYNNNSYSSDWTLGEMIVTRGYFHSAREAIEGYLAVKMGIE